MIEIVQEQIRESEILQSVKSENAGANVLFVGTTRKMTGDRETTTLHYDAYSEMAIKEMERLQNDAIEKWSITECSIVHRVGEVPIGEASIAVAVSSPHRKCAFESASWIMDELKKEVPIWKKEVWVDGTSDWIHPESNKQQLSERN